MIEIACTTRHRPAAATQEVTHITRGVLVAPYVSHRASNIVILTRCYEPGNFTMTKLKHPDAHDGFRRPVLGRLPASLVFAKHPVAGFLGAAET